MKTDEELDEMSDEQLLRYYNRRFKSKTLNDDENVIYYCIDRPSPSVMI